MIWPELRVPSLSPETTRLAEQLAVSPLLAQLLINRKLGPEEARWMLQSKPDLEWPRPDFLPELQALFLHLLQESAPIAIFGDYDADGLSGTAVLTVFLRSAGFRVTPVLPTRSQGYGLNTATLESLAAQGNQLLITVDCGISNREEIQFAQSQGLKVIVTDHHGLPTLLPEATFILHPAVLNIERLANLSGAGMAYWLTILLKAVLPEAMEPEALLDLAVLGTLADMTPLRGLNFALAKRGLQAAAKTQRPGLLALAQLKNLNLETLTEDDLTFRMIPLLNAAGRLDSPQPSLDLLLSETPREAEHLAQKLAEMNTQRQALCETVLSDALELLQDEDLPAAIVLADTQWLHGVLGITCSQLVERFHRPVALLAIEGEFAKASVRAPRGYHVLQALQACDDLLERYGGHEMAGGFTVKTERIPDFTARFEAVCHEQQERVRHEQAVEMELNPEVLSLEQWQELRQLAPFGMGNPHPLFLSLNVPLEEIKSDRRTQRHFFAHLPSGVRLKGWRMWEPELEQETHFDLVYSLDRSEWRERVQLELTLQLLRPHRRPQRQPQRPSVPKRLEKDTAPQEILAGYFWDGEQYWHLLRPPVALETEPEWQDLRGRSLPVNTEACLRYRTDVPSGTEVFLAQCQDFDCLDLDQPPLPAVLPDLLYAFRRIRVLSQVPLMPPPDFRQLWTILTWMQEEGAGLHSAQELARLFSLTSGQASICLKSLCDLGLLAYDNERYRIQYKNQLYDLRQSKTFMSARQTWEQRQTMAQLWDQVSLERLKKWLYAGKVTDV